MTSFYAFCCFCKLYVKTEYYAIERVKRMKTSADVLHKVYVIFCVSRFMLLAGFRKELTSGL